MLLIQTPRGCELVVGWGEPRSPDAHPVMDVGRIFLNRLADLEQRCSNRPGPPDEDAEYRLLMAAPLLREFLIDQPSIVNRLNRKYRLKLRFRCVPLESMEARGLPQPMLHMAADGFAMPDEVNPAFVRDLSLDQFLKATVGVVEGEALSVYDLVDYLANAAGGIHYENPEDRVKGNRPVVRRLHEALSLQGMGAGLYGLRGVGRVTVVALKPLADAVSEVEAD